MSSDKSYPETEEWHNEYLSSDIVLNVHDIQEYAPQLGYLTVCDTITNGMHDLILSEKAARDQTYHVVFEWIKWMQGSLLFSLGTSHASLVIFTCRPECNRFT